jgi:hypothetical protein
MRIAAYMCSTVMRYLDCIIQWADNLFMREDRESINQAAQPYAAAEILKAGAASRRM